MKMYGRRPGKGKGSIGTPTTILPLTRKEMCQKKQRKLDRKRKINDIRNWHVDSFGNPYYTHYKSGQMLTGIECPGHILNQLKGVNKQEAHQ